jgi:hypothetical protein
VIKVGGGRAGPGLGDRPDHGSATVLHLDHVFVVAFFFSFCPLYLGVVFGYRGRSSGDVIPSSNIDSQPRFGERGSMALPMLRCYMYRIARYGRRTTNMLGTSMASNIRSDLDANTCDRQGHFFGTPLDASGTLLNRQDT